MQRRVRLDLCQSATVGQHGGVGGGPGAGSGTLAHQGGLGGGKSPGKTLGRRRSLTDDQVQLARRMKDTGASGRKIAELLEVNEKTVRNALKAGP